MLDAADHPLRRSAACRRRIRAGAVRSATSACRRTIDRLFTRVGIEPRVAETENVEILKALVASGWACRSFRQSVDDEVRAGKLAVARIAGTVLERETGWVYPRSSHLPRAVQELIRTLDTIRPTLTLAPDAAALGRE